MIGQLGVRLLHLVMALYLTASGIELLDRSGIADDHPVVGDTAATLREVRAWDDPLGVVDEVDRIAEVVRRLSDGFDEAGDTLN